jgi:tRNA threonylcarbamoyladenosine biosynthesis protein TsaE
MTLESPNPAATHEIGQRLGAVLTAGDVVALIGPLGSGKTTLVKGIAGGAGVPDPKGVNSPTFVIVNEYETARSPLKLRLYHIDTYRLRHAGDLDALGFDEMLAGGAVLIEWADRVSEFLPPDRLTLELESLSEESRRFRAHAGGPRSERLLAALTSG